VNKQYRLQFKAVYVMVVMYATSAICNQDHIIMPTITSII